LCVDAISDKLKLNKERISIMISDLAFSITAIK